jgi:hypothetical protein
MNPLDMDTAEIKILRAIDDVRAAQSDQFSGRVSTVLGRA